MRKLPGFKDHKCYAEQKIAYNYLFSQAHINEWSIDRILYNIDNFNTDKLKRYDITAIKKCITDNYINYMKKPFIAGSYQEIAEKLPL